MSQNQHGGDIYRNRIKLDFSVNVNPLGIPEPVRQAFLKSVEDLSHYPDPQAEELRNVLGVHYQIPANWILCGNGCGDLIYGLAAAKKPKRALVLAPTFSEYESALQWAACEIVHMPLYREEEFRLKPDTFITFIQKENKKRPLDMLFLCNPNNPTGMTLHKEEMKRVAEVCSSLGIFLVVDECFGEFLEEWQEYTLREEIADNSNLIILNAFTKTYALAGLRLGYALCSDEHLLFEMTRGRQPWSVSLPAQKAGVAALSVSGYMEKTRSFLKVERAWLKQELKQLGYVVYPSDTNYLFFENPNESRGSLFQWCKKEGILIRDCSNYQGLRGGDYRISIRTRKENEALLAVLKSYQSVVFS